MDIMDGMDAMDLPFDGRMDRRKKRHLLHASILSIKKTCPFVFMMSIASILVHVHSP
jgi:hypothetical protein